MDEKYCDSEKMKLLKDVVGPLSNEEMELLMKVGTRIASKSVGPLEAREGVSGGVFF
ncbi:hypothetical protein OCF52_26590 [Bacillus cereus]|nr:hypothetical protein [Bacillus cereus]